MGGRGAGSPGRVMLPPDVLAALPYNVTSFDDPLGGATFPFLEQTQRAWRILTRSVDEVAEPHAAHTFGLERPTLRWVNGSEVSDLYVDGMTTEDFLEATGLELDMHKGGFVLSKRLSRLMRPHFVSGFFEAGEVQVAYMTQTPEEAKVWDGAGLISRRMLRKLMTAENGPLDRLPPAKQDRIERELRLARRVEFTVMTEKGQDKGHAIVVDDGNDTLLRDEDGRQVDFLLPEDTKREVRLVPSKGPRPGTSSGPVLGTSTEPVLSQSKYSAQVKRSGQDRPKQTDRDGRSALDSSIDTDDPAITGGPMFTGGPTSASGPTFVGLSFVHGHNDMRLDIQSLINLHPFFKEEQLLGWLRDEGELFVNAVETGEVAEAMGRIDRHTTIEEVQAWPLREYLASGGQPMWFRSHVKSLMNQHLKRLNHSTLTKMRLPIPGGRHYVMPAGVGKRAGIKGLTVPRGHIHIDDQRGTAWVNDEDWLALPDSPKRPGSPGEGIAGILGGADNDDALWLHPFTDYDGVRKVLAWRSPNQVGEYVILEPTADSAALSWTKGDGETAVFPPADSRKLPQRVDFSQPKYLGLVNPETAGGSGKSEGYSVEVMETAVNQAIANQGALGMYCNSLMLNKALYGRLPDYPPAPLEDIIDSAVKTGADLSEVARWNYTNSREILESHIPIPSILHQRLSIDWSDKENRPPLPRISGMAGNEAHWLDGLEAGVKAHIQEMQQRRDELVVQARPPELLFEQVSAENVRLGAGLNQTYAAALRMGKGRHENVLERAKAEVEDYLAHFPSERREKILLGALVSVYGKEGGGSDTAVWLAGGKETLEQAQVDFGEPSIAHLTVEALRQSGFLDDLIVTKEGLVVYPKELNTGE